ncbi:MAG: FKBP-type peptidyl-prolyl cis-trans isomerase [Bacteroidetes bacterium]|uniref:Peptidyl-prolyl cis-trans isomerase n=1 Tax=Candidatus Cryptobacteroides excrementavium TaxID=2840759 RepID=A0A9D9NSC0_9BACT|nr:FKBP-type peptidyl-prolyl cis-trans isomerase [Candidatus Cryptobacteroides excrementavium]
MKKIVRIIAATAAAAAIFTACGSSQKSNVKVDAELPTHAETDSVSYLIGINFGYFIKANNFGEDLNYSEIRKGMMDFIKAEGEMNTPEFNAQFKVNPDQMNKLLNSYITKRNNYEAAVNKAEGEEFMKANKMKDGIVVTDSGLQYRIVEAGNDVKAGPKDTVWVQYTGTLIDGTEFDASDPEKEPVRMILTRVIKGWTEGLQLVGEGGTIELFVPDSLAYGARKMGKIGPNSTLIFDVDVVKVGKVPAEEEK